MSNLNKPEEIKQVVEVFHIVYYLEGDNTTSRGINVYGNTIEEILAVFKQSFPTAKIVYMMNKTAELG